MLRSDGHLRADRAESERGSKGGEPGWAGGEIDGDRDAHHLRLGVEPLRAENAEEEEEEREGREEERGEVEGEGTPRDPEAHLHPSTQGGGNGGGGKR